jgi:putative flippase GtrA
MTFHKTSISICGNLLDKTGYRHLILQFFSYAFSGGIATLVDWSSFFLLSARAGYDYRIAVSISFTIGSLTNYLLNRLITFKDRTSTIALQLGIFAAICIISLFLSQLLMLVFIEAVELDPMMARILTTFNMLAINFVMHKFLTYNTNLYILIFNRSVYEKDK